MDLTPNDDQITYQTATAEWCRAHMTLEGARSRPDHLWDKLEAMGWTGMTAPAMGLDHATEALVFAELGRFLAPVGLVSTAVANRWFPGTGGGKVALALTSARAVPLRVLDPGGSRAALMQEPRSIRLFNLPDRFVDERTGAMQETPHSPTIDLATMQSRREWATSQSTTDDPAPLLHLQLLAAAYALGCGDAARDMAAGYASIRQQFGRPIGWFQAIKHMCADMAVRAAAARSQLYYAACALDAGDTDAAFHVAAARRLADQAALENARANIQVHGGIGMTDEAYPHLCLKRAHLLQFIAPADTAVLLTT